MPRFIVMLIGLTVASGCNGREGLHESGHTPATATGSLLDPAPIVDIGGLREGDPILLSVTSATRVPDGIAIADYRAHAILFFDLRGRLIRRVGREGSGPGEFRLVRTTSRCHGDSLFAWDHGLKRMTVYDVSGNMVREYRTPVFLHRMTCSRQGVVAMLMQPSRFYGPAEMGRRPRSTALLLLAGPTGDTIATIGEVPLGDQRPLGRVTAIAMSADRLYVATGDSAFVDVYALDGTRRGALAVGGARRRVTKEAYDAELDRMVRGMRTSGGGDTALRRMLGEIPIPEYLPAYGEVTAAPDGTLWVVVSLAADSATTVRAVSSTGTILGEVVLPAESRVLEAGEDYLLVGYDAGDGEPHVAMYGRRH